MVFPGYEKVVELLLRKGANFNIKKIRTKGTPLHYATIGGNLIKFGPLAIRFINECSRIKTA